MTYPTVTLRIDNDEDYSALEDFKTVTGEKTYTKAILSYGRDIHYKEKKLVDQAEEIRLLAQKLNDIKEALYSKHEAEVFLNSWLKQSTFLD